MGTRKENANLTFYSLLNTEEERKKRYNFSTGNILYSYAEDPR